MAPNSYFVRVCHPRRAVRGFYPIVVTDDRQRAITIRNPYRDADGAPILARIPLVVTLILAVITALAIASVIVGATKLARDGLPGTPHVSWVEITIRMLIGFCICVPFFLLFLLSGIVLQRHFDIHEGEFRFPNGRCLGCGHDFTQLPREADGCVVCPQCFAAWRVPET